MVGQRITTPRVAEQVLEAGQADLIFTVDDLCRAQAVHDELIRTVRRPVEMGVEHMNALARSTLFPGRFWS